MLTVMSQNIQYGPDARRWARIIDVIRQTGPQLLLLQEADHLQDPGQAAAARAALDMELYVAPSRSGRPVAVAWDPAHLRVEDVETRYAGDLHHGYAAARIAPWGLAAHLPAPLVAVSAHLIPYSTQQAAVEAQILAARVYRHGGIGLIAGDINHPTFDDPEIDWTKVKPYNRASRCLPREHPGDPWISNRAVGRVLRDADLTDIAAHLADARRDPALRRATGKHGGLRVDQIHVTPALTPAAVDYKVIEHDYSDHLAVTTTFDLDRVDRGRLVDFT
ncbi:MULTISPECIES: endonuclease/exonuclease/phosphatase family protein [Streptomycetaceae]|uniref:endonuclease/exonuclease/phosphatase family protein n=1 Tax=Streptomycetaceae TaxID=2062 RepID=UPI00093E40EE|nr:endonuclease/exonuclease/phosphatase family protein [Streptomyces sp. CB02056]OKH97554.1 hypothetical protein AMK13_38295 [Streptomyces sp. CB02056]